MLVNNEPGSAVIEGGRDCHCGSPSQLEVVVNDVAAIAAATLHNKEGMR